MGCSQNRAEALKELQEEIKKLKEMKSKILIATDTTKEASKIYDLSDEELGFLVKKYTKEYEDLQLELQRLENLGTQESVIKSKQATAELLKSEKEGKSSKQRHCLVVLLVALLLFVITMIATNYYKHIEVNDK